MNSINFRSRQGGATLIISLIMMVIITLFALSAINSSTVNLKIAGNMQSQDEARAAGQKAIETFISNNANFNPVPTAATSITVDINNDTVMDYTVSIAPPCLKRAALQVPARSVDCANGEKSGLHCWDVIYDIEATARDLKTGASQVVTQGVSKTQDPSYMPPATGC